jgi:hypothetical protein
MATATFQDQHWQSRFASMGDEAEAVFESVYEHGFTRYGLDRPPIAVGKLPLKLRYTPDYHTSAGLVEVQGFGQQQLIKVKVEKLTALEMWQQDAPVRLFFFDKTHSACALQPLAEFTRNVYAHAALDRFPEGKPFFFLDAADLEVTWTRVDTPAKS